MTGSDKSKVSFQGLLMAAIFVFFVGCLFYSPILIPLVGGAIQEYFNRIDFDSEVWKDPKVQSLNNPMRIRMVDDLLWEYDLEGMTSKEVTELLGPTDKTDYFSSWDFVYWLGPERGFLSIDSEWLVLKLDPEGKVREYKIETD